MSSSERVLSSAQSQTAELEFARKHIAALSSAATSNGGLSYGREFELEQDERERRVPHVAVSRAMRCQDMLRNGC